MYFATFDPEAPALREYLGEMTWYLDAFFDRREGGIEVIGGMHKWVMPCNWKLPAENFGGDTCHVQWSHLSAVSSIRVAIRAPAACLYPLLLDNAVPAVAREAGKELEVRPCD